jgi:hypothetical protein
MAVLSLLLIPRSSPMASAEEGLGHHGRRTPQTENYCPDSCLAGHCPVLRAACGLAPGALFSHRGPCPPSQVKGSAKRQCAAVLYAKPSHCTQKQQVCFRTVLRLNYLLLRQLTAVPASREKSYDSANYFLPKTAQLCCIDATDFSASLGSSALS